MLERASEGLISAIHRRLSREIRALRCEIAPAQAAYASSSTLSSWRTNVVHDGTLRLSVDDTAEIVCDFLYPPLTQQWRPSSAVRRSARNASLLRRYHDSSLASRGSTRAISTSTDSTSTSVADHPPSGAGAPFGRPRSVVAPVQHVSNNSHRPHDHSVTRRTTQSSPHALYQLFHKSRAAIKQDPSSVSHTERLQRAWRIYVRLIEDVEDRISLRRRMLQWLSLHHNRFAEEKALEVFESIAEEKYDSTLYMHVIPVMLRLSMKEDAIKLYNCILADDENKFRLARILVLHAISIEDWDLALRMERECRETSDGTKLVQHEYRLWASIEKVSNLLEKARSLMALVSEPSPVRKLSTSNRSFIGQVYKIALCQRAGHQRSASTERSKTYTGLTKEILDAIPSIMKQETTEISASFKFMLKEILHDDQRYPPTQVQGIVSHLYRSLRDCPKHDLDNATWDLLFRRTLWVYSRQDDPSARAENLSLDELYEACQMQKQELPRHTFDQVLVTLARIGRQNEFDVWADRYKLAHPQSPTDRDIKSYRIYLHARRGEHRQATDVFHQVSSAAGQRRQPLRMETWRAMILAYARSDNLTRVRKMFRRMSRHGVAPDAYCVQPVLEMLSKRGLSRSIQKTIRRYKTDFPSSVVPADMYAPLIVAYLRTGEIGRAIRCLDWLHGRLERKLMTGELTIHYNRILTDLAMQRNVDGLYKMLARMQTRRVPINASTYGPILLIMTLQKRTNEAWKLLTEMQSAGLQPSSLHYSIIMNGFYKQKEYEKALNVFNIMQEENVPRSYKVEAALVRIKTAIAAEKSNAIEADDWSESSAWDISTIKHDINKYSAQGNDGQGRADNDAIGTTAIASELLKEHSALDVPQLIARDSATAGRIAGDNITDVYPDAPFEILVAEYSRTRNLDVALALASSYPAAIEKTRFPAKKPSILLLTNLMEAFMKLRDFEAVDDFWRGILGRVSRTGPQHSRPILNLDQVAEVNALFGNLHQPKPWYVPRKMPWIGRRAILSRPAGIYLHALAAQDRHLDILLLFSRMLVLGFSFENTTWNLFIRYLCNTDPPRTLLAFALTERFLIDGFPGWKDESDPKVKQQTMEKSTDWLHIRIEETPARTLLPEWPTITALNSALLQLSRRDLLVGCEEEMIQYVGSKERVAMVAPQTLAVVRSMPRAHHSTFLQRRKVLYSHDAQQSARPRGTFSTRSSCRDVNNQWSPMLAALRQLRSAPLGQNHRTVQGRLRVRAQPRSVSGVVSSRKRRRREASGQAPDMVSRSASLKWLNEKEAPSLLRAETMREHRQPV